MSTGGYDEEVKIYVEPDRWRVEASGRRREG